jgi:hypothetical protein
MSLQLEKKAVEFDGKRYELVCNMEALELLEDEFGGSMKAVMEKSVEHVSAALFRIMLNLAREDLDEEPVEKRQISRLYSPAMLQEMDIFGLFLRAMSVDAAKKAQNQEEPGKN